MEQEQFKKEVLPSRGKLLSYARRLLDDSEDAEDVIQEVLFNPYEGSYIVRNGVRITDMNEVGPVLETTLQRIEQQQKRVEQLLENANNRDENICLVELNMQQKYRALLNRLPNKYARDEVEKILDIR